MNRFTWLTNIVSWLFLSKLGQNKFLNSFSIWLIIVPLLSNFLSNFPDEFIFSILSKQYTLVFTLPFNWVAFYFCSFFFTIANVYFNFCCPPVIKNFENYEDYKDKFGCKYYLCKTITQLKNPSKTNRYIDKYFEENTAQNISITEKSNLLREECLPDVFFELRDDSNLLTPFKRIFLFSIYLLAILLLGYVFYENTLTVYSLYITR